MNKPLISTVIIFYNSREFLEEAVESVLEQTYDNWELLLVDDGSDDGSSALAGKYRDKLPAKVFYLEHPGHENRGMSASRNLGIRFSRGEFLTFLDSDDKYLPRKFEQQLKIFASHPDISCVIGATKYWFNWNGTGVKKDIIQTLQIPSRIYEPGELFKLFLKQKAATPSICSILIKRNLVENIGGFEESFKGMYEDHVFYAKVALTGIIYVDNNYYELYRKHSNSCYQRSIAAGTVIDHENKYLNWLYNYLQNKNIRDQGLLNIIKKELWLNKHPFFDYIHRRFLKQKRKFFPVRK